jgi:hypothetical protein
MSDYIMLDGIRQFIIEFINPADLDNDLIEGMRKKEVLLSKIDPCLLRRSIKNFDELNSVVTNTLGYKYIDAVLGRYREDYYYYYLHSHWISDSTEIIE